MTTLNQIKIKNPDGSKHAFGPLTITGTTVGSSVTVPSQKYSCGYNHTLTGTQETSNKMGGNGVNPWPDPGPPKAEEVSVGGAVGPSWEATTGGPEPTK